MHLNGRVTELVLCLSYFCEEQGDISGKNMWGFNFIITSLYRKRELYEDWVLIYNYF